MESLSALIIEDAPHTAWLVDLHLRRAGFEVQIAETGAEGLERATAWLPRVVVLDVRLPDIDGFAICSALRAREAPTAGIGVLMLMAHGLAEDRVRAFEHGADDVMTMPFSVRELTLRVCKLARRVPDPAAGTPAPRLRCGPIELDLRTLEVRVSGTQVELRASEIRLLQVLMERPGAVLSREELLLRVWDRPGPHKQRVVDVAMRRLRAALGEQATLIETIYNGGYRLRNAV